MEMDQIQRLQKLAASIDSLQKVGREAGATHKKTGANGAVDFGKLLETALARQTPLRFSKHVQDRIERRQISVDADQLQQLNQALNLAQEKGIRDSLVLTRDTAFILNVPNKTVVTAMPRDAQQPRVFTNIDGAIVTS